MADPLILVRGVHFAATLLACGTVGFVALTANPPGRKVGAGFATLRHRLNVLIWLALAVAVATGAAWLVLLASDILGASIADVCLRGGVWPVLFDTRFGMVWCIRLALALLLGLSLAWPQATGLQLTAAAALLVLLALTGHAGATPGAAGDFHLAADMAHLLAAGAWLGALPAFVLLLGQAHRAATQAWSGFAIQVTRRFSVVGILSVGTLLASGLTNSWFLLGGPRDLVATEYGRLVALKVGLFAAMVAIAAVNRFYLTPQLPARRALLSLKRNSLAEICLGLGVLMFVGALGTLSPSGHAHVAPEDIPPDAAFVHIHAPEAMADVTIDPGHPGPAEVKIRVAREDFSLFPAKAVHLALDPPAPGGPVLERAATVQADGTWVVDQILLSEPGIWTVRVIVTPGKGQPILLDAPIVIER